MTVEVKKRRRGHSRISSKHQVTIPAEALQKAGFKPGDVLRVAASGPGRIELLRDEDVLARYAGSLTGVFGLDYLEELRSEWE